MLTDKKVLEVKKKLISAINKKETQLKKLKQHINKSEICSDIYDRVLIEKAVLKKQLDELQNSSIVDKIRHLLPHKKERLICDYFKS